MWVIVGRRTLQNVTCLSHSLCHRALGLGRSCRRGAATTQLPHQTSRACNTPFLSSHTTQLLAAATASTMDSLTLAEQEEVAALHDLFCELDLERIAAIYIRCGRDYKDAQTEIAKLVTDPEALARELEASGVSSLMLSVAFLAAASGHQAASQQLDCFLLPRASPRHSRNHKTGCGQWRSVQWAHRLPQNRVGACMHQAHSATG